LLEAEVITDGTYPEYEQIMPTTDPVDTFSMNPAYLVDACKTLDKGEPVTIKSHGPNNPIELHGTLEGLPVYALIMPMHGEKDYYWRPGR
jgi:DNA polymerase III sliding clamp (beta) subunit (PCNA family)